MTDRNLEPASFEGAQLAQMRKWVHDGKGADELFDQAKNWNGEDSYLRELKGRVEGKLKEVGAVMQSESGEAMKNQAMPIVLWTEVAADSAKLQSEQMNAQGEAFTKVQSSIPKKSEEESVPDDNWIEEGWDTMWTGSTDAEDAKAHNEKLRQEAVQAFTTYQDSSQTAVSGSAQFEPPPGETANVAVAGSDHPTVGGVQSPSSSPSSTSSAWAGGSGSGAGYAGGSGGAGYSGGSGAGSPAGSGSAWATTPGPNSGGSGPGGNAGTGGRPGTSGYPGGGTGVPGTGRPGTGSGGARGGSGAGRGAGTGAGRGLGAGGAGGAGRAGGPGMGAGGRAGVGGLGGASGSTAASGGAGGAGGRGAGMAGAGARGRGQEGEDDMEHETPDYLVGDQGVFDEDLPRVAPPVFGE